jgi:hypothetical protein
MAQSWPSHHAEKEGNNMIAGVFEIRRSVAVIVVACLLIVGGVTGAALSSWAKHNPVAAAPPASIGVSGKNAEAGPPNAMGFACVEARAGSGCKHLVFAYSENAPGTFRPLL